MSNVNPRNDANLKLFSILTGVFVATLLLANVTSAKLIQLGPLVLPGGVFIFPLSFLFGDILTEIYGYERSRKVIWTGFACQLLAAFMYWLVGVLPPAPFWTDQAAYDRILGFIPRVAVGSICAFFAGEFCNSWVLSKMKYSAGGKRGLAQAWRYVASTIVGEAVDTIVIMTIAFGGLLTVGQFITTAASVYVVKVVFEVAATPVSVPITNWMKRIEGVDHIDLPEQTDYNPFAIIERST